MKLSEAVVRILRLRRRVAHYEKAIAQAENHAARPDAPPKWAKKVPELHNALVLANAELVFTSAKLSDEENAELAAALAAPDDDEVEAGG